MEDIYGTGFGEESSLTKDIPQDIYSRTRLLYGNEKLLRIRNAKVAIFGLGGVGGHVAEALARAGAGSLLILDGDIIAKSNINRQIIATTNTIGRPKTEVMEGRIREINPEICVKAIHSRLMPENAYSFNISGYDFVADAIDDVPAKIALVTMCDSLGVPIISSMGTANKKEPSMLEIADIYKTSVCPLARVMRRELKRRGIKGLKVVYSKEEPVKNGPKKGSSPTVPAIAGLLMASYIINSI